MPKEDEAHCDITSASQISFPLYSKEVPASKTRLDCKFQDGRNLPLMTQALSMRMSSPRIALLGCLCIISSCGDLPSPEVSDDVNIEVSFHVMTPEGEKTGSAVWNYKGSYAKNATAHDQPWFSSSGNAIPIQMHDGVLYILPYVDRGGKFLTNAMFSQVSKGKDIRKDWKRNISSWKSQGLLFEINDEKSVAFPTMVFLLNNNPKNTIIADKSNNYKIEKSIIMTTKKNIGSEFCKYAIWYNKYKETSFDGKNQDTRFYINDIKSRLYSKYFGIC